MSELTDRITEVLREEFAPWFSGFCMGAEVDIDADYVLQLVDEQAAEWAAAVADALQPEMDRLARLQDYYDNTGVYVAKSKLAELLVKP